MQQPLRIAKRDLVRPPVLLLPPAPPKPPTVVAPTVPPAAESKEPATSVASKPVSENVDSKPGIQWGNWSISASGFAALKDIRSLRTYGYSGSAQYMLPGFFSHRYRVFGRLHINRLISENYDYLFVPFAAGVHALLYQALPELNFYGEFSLGAGYLEVTRGNVERDAWKGNVQAVLGACYFLWQNFSLNLELAAFYITRDQSAGNILRIQLAATYHL